MSLRVKFSLLMAGLLLFTILVLSILVLNGIQNNQQKKLQHELTEFTSRAELSIKQSFLSGESSTIKEFLQYRGMELSYKLGQSSGLHVILYNEEGSQIGNSIPMVPSPPMSEVLQYALQNKIAYTQIQDTLYYMAPIELDQKLVAVIEFQKPIGDLNDFYKQTKRMFIVFGTAVLLFSFALGFLYVYRQSQAIVLLKRTANSIGRGQYVREVPLKRKDELGELSQGIYRMSREIEMSMHNLGAEKAKLTLAVEKLQALEQQQKHFINNVSHELKTPLTAITAYADLLAMYNDDPLLLQQAQENIHKEASRLYDLVEKMLQLNKSETYAFDYQPEAVSLNELLEDLCERMKGKAEKFGLSLNINVSEAVIWAERESLIHIFVNLLDNAIKYNIPGGNVSVTLKEVDNRANVEITDTGIGIPLESRERIFEPFYTVNKARSRETGGSGLGLALVKEWVEKQQGVIHLIHSDAAGSVFEVSFPLCPSADGKFTT
ncbi:Alkaline phosphatase synthesis sensor protein PhoR [compost metagenome]